MLLRLDSLSHILCWADMNVGPEDPSVHVDQVELRRLRLTFRARWMAEEEGAGEGAEGAGGRSDGREQYKLYLDGQSDLFISSFRSPAICKLLEGLPTAVLLENKVRALFVLTAFSFGRCGHFFRAGVFRAGPRDGQADHAARDHRAPLCARGGAGPRQRELAEKPAGRAPLHVPGAPLRRLPCHHHPRLRAAHAAHPPSGRPVRGRRARRGLVRKRRLDERGGAAAVGPAGQRGGGRAPGRLRLPPARLSRCARLPGHHEDPLADGLHVRAVPGAQACGEQRVPADVGRGAVSDQAGAGQPLRAPAQHVRGEPQGVHPGAAEEPVHAGVRPQLHGPPRVQFRVQRAAHPARRPAVRAPGGQVRAHLQHPRGVPLEAGELDRVPRGVRAAAADGGRGHAPQGARLDGQVPQRVVPPQLHRGPQRPRLSLLLRDAHREPQLHLRGERAHARRRERAAAAAARGGHVARLADEHLTGAGGQPGDCRRGAQVRGQGDEHVLGLREHLQGGRRVHQGVHQPGGVVPAEAAPVGVHQAAREARLAGPGNGLDAPPDGAEPAGEAGRGQHPVANHLPLNRGVPALPGAGGARPHPYVPESEGLHPEPSHAAGGGDAAGVEPRRPGREPQPIGRRQVRLHAALPAGAGAVCTRARAQGSRVQGRGRLLSLRGGPAPLQHGARRAADGAAPHDGRQVLCREGERGDGAPHAHAL
eukprot:1182341-Prorocentrum_minimum.AAC.2